MPVVLPFSHEKPADLKVVQLGTTRYGVRLTWRERPASWYLDLETAEGVAVVSGLRVVPGASPALRLGPWRAQGPGGALYVRGPDPYVREDLGGALRLVWYGPDELPKAAASDLIVVV